MSRATWLRWSRSSTMWALATHCKTVVEPRWFVKMRKVGQACYPVCAGGQNQICFLSIEMVCVPSLRVGGRIQLGSVGTAGITVARETPEMLFQMRRAAICIRNWQTQFWFSSALWPFPPWAGPTKPKKDLHYSYPTDALSKFHSRCPFFFSVARMIFSGLEHVGETPFDTVFIHGIVRMPRTA